MHYVIKCTTTWLNRPYQDSGSPLEHRTLSLRLPYLESSWNWDRSKHICREFEVGFSTTESLSLLLIPFSVHLSFCWRRTFGSEPSLVWKSTTIQRFSTCGTHYPYRCSAKILVCFKSVKWPSDVKLYAKLKNVYLSDTLQKKLEPLYFMFCFSPSWG